MDQTNETSAHSGAKRSKAKMSENLFDLSKSAVTFRGKRPLSMGERMTGADDVVMVSVDLKMSVELADNGVEVGDSIAGVISECLKQSNKKDSKAKEGGNTSTYRTKDKPELSNYVFAGDVPLEIGGVIAKAPPTIKVVDGVAVIEWVAQFRIPESELLAVAAMVGDNATLSTVQIQQELDLDPKEGDEEEGNVRPMRRKGKR
jgi:hypothetical protein